MSDRNDVVYVLGLDYEVKDAIPWTDAVTHILTGTMTPFKVHPTRRVRSAGGEIDMAWPEIVRLNYWVTVPKQKAIDPKSRASRHEILRRDGWTCVYCGANLSGKSEGRSNATVDHIIPESWCKRNNYPHNGWTFDNLAACCIPCNSYKANRTPEEAGMKLLWQPHTNVNRYSRIQAEVFKILETGENYFAEDSTAFEGVLRK